MTEHSQPSVDLGALLLATKDIPAAAITDHDPDNWSHVHTSRWLDLSHEKPTRWEQMLREGVNPGHVLLHPDFVREVGAEMKRSGQPAYIAKEMVINPYRAFGRADERLTRQPNILVRVLAWFLRPIIWEAMRQHPSVDNNRCTGEPMLTLRDAVRGRNRHMGHGA